jgi:uncharacterized membrane-anchored protein
MGPRLLVAASLILCGLSVPASGQGPSPKSIEEFDASLGYQTGTVTLSDGMVTIRLPESFRFIGPDGSRRLLTEAWGNPAESADGVLGMLIPADSSPVADKGWGIIITYDEDGFVDDEDATAIDYTEMLAQMQEATRAANEERQKAGFEPVRLVGWAEPPSYDRQAHKMYWARELAFGESDEHTLNYAIRVLGRRGVLVLNAVASIDQLDAIRRETKGVMAAIEFNEGHRYTDYLPGKDKAASYGIAGLILGATATKAGLFKVLIASLLAFKKGLVLAVLALGALIKKLFTKKPVGLDAPPPLPR